MNFNPEHVKEIAIKIHLLNVNRKRILCFKNNYNCEIIEWENLSEKKKNELVNIANLLLNYIFLNLSIEDCSCLLHNYWVLKNHNIATSIQKLSYCFISNFEKKKYYEIYHLAKIYENCSSYYIS